MPSDVHLARIIKNGSSVGIILPPDLLAQLKWSRDDRLCMRRHRNALVLERIPLEQLALIKPPEQETHDSAQR